MTSFGNPGIDLGTRQLSTFTRLGTLRHLDLQLTGVDQIVAGDTKATRSHLLDGTVLAVAQVVAPGIAVGVFATFAGVASATDAVHGDCQCLVRFLADRAIAHGTGLEAFDNFSSRLHLFNRDGSGVEFEVEQRPDRAEILFLRIDQTRVFLKSLVALFPDIIPALAHCILQAVDGAWVKEMAFAVGAPLIVTTGFQRCRFILAIGEGTLVAHLYFFKDLRQANAFDTGWCPGKVGIHQFLAQAERFEDLRTAVALQRADAHLRADFDDTFEAGFDVLISCLVVLGIRQQPLLDHVVDGFIGHVGIDRGCAVANQQREMMHLARFAAFDDDGAAGAGLLADEMVMQPCRCQQCRNRCHLVRDATVGENEDIKAKLNGTVCQTEELVQRLLHALPAFTHGEEQRQFLRPEAGFGNVIDLCQLLVGEDWVLNANQAGVFGNCLQNVAFAAHHHIAGGDQFFTQRIQRRVGDLGKELAEVGIEQLRLVREHRNRRVIAHAAQCFNPILCHGHHQGAQGFKGVAKRLLPLQNAGMVIGGVEIIFRRRLQLIQLDQMIIQPLLIGVGVCHRVLDFVIADDAALRGIDQEHAARLQA